MNTKAGIGTPYWFEWEVGLHKCLEMLQNDSVESVVFQSSKFSSLDDVVVNYKDGSISNIQVKHSDVGDTFTFSALLSGSNPMIVKWAEDWQRNKKIYRIKEINITTNRKWGTYRADKCCSFNTFVQKVLTKWKQNKEYVSDREDENNAIQKIKNSLAFLKDDLHEFISILNFIKVPERDELSKQIRCAISSIIGSDNQYAIEVVERNLVNQLRVWTTSLREKEEIYREDVYNVICNNQIEISKYDVYPEKPIFPSRVNFAVKFTETLMNTQKKLVFLRGLPGAGKTNFVSYLSELDDSPVDFRFYTYLPIKKNETFFSIDSGYFSSRHLWESLLVQLKNKFAELKSLNEVQFPLCYGFMTDQEKRQTVLRFLGLYSQKVKRCVYVFIDGMDHAARAASRGNATFLDSLPREKEIEGDVKFVFVGQPLHDKYPALLSCDSKNIEFLDLPVIEVEDVSLLLKYNDLSLEGVNQNSLSESIINVVGNNALNVFFAIYEFKAVYSSGMTYDEFIETLRTKNLDGQIEKYYEWIFNSVSDDFTIKKISILFAFLSKKITSEDMALLLEIKEHELKYYLDKLYPLIQCDDNGYFCYHNDVRLFFADKVLCNSYSSDVIKSFFNTTNSNDQLREIGYYYLFDALSTLEDKSFLYELYTSHYIIKSLQYSIPIELIEYQLIYLFNDFYENRRIDKTIEICSVVKTYYQLVNCVQWNGKENLFLDTTKKLTSEKYILKNHEEIEQIINDNYKLLQSNLLERGNALFKEYLSEYSLKDYFNFFIDKNDKGDTIKKLGAICREFNRDILLNANVEESSHYADFVSGWLEQSNKKKGLEELKYTLSFKLFYPKDLFNYVKCNISHLDLPAIEYLQKKEMRNPIFSILIEICVEKILRNCYDKELIEYLRKRSKDIFTDNIFEFDYDRIPYYFKLLFCIYGTMDKKTEKEFYDFYIKILANAHITEKDRGFIPALKLFDCAKNIFAFFQNGKNPYEQVVEIIASLIYFDEHYGAGSSNDCNSFEVKRFLFQIIIESIKKENDSELINRLCESLAKYAFMGQKPKYYSELVKLFHICGDTEKLALKIFNFWAGDNGIVWNSEYTEIEYICDDIIGWLRKEKDFEDAEKIDRRKKLKLIGYVGRKDYSMMDVLDWYKLLPDSKEKFFEGIKLLSVSDYASKMGDNRISSSIDETVFELAINLGPYYVDCLFNIKNTPDKFYYWRECFISGYLKYIEANEMSDKDLLALYSIANAWIKPEIEKTRKYHDSTSDYINQINCAIVSKIRDESLRNNLLIDIPMGSKEIEEKQSSAEPPTDKAVEVLLSYIEENGLDSHSENLLINYLSSYKDVYGRIFEQLDKIISDADRPIFVKKYMLPYIKENNEYGYYGKGFDRLIKNNYMHISTEEYFALMQVSFSNILKGKDYVYSVVDDMETLSLSLFKATHFDDVFAIFKKKLELHITWITSCYEFKVEFYNNVFDNDVKTLEDFSHKYIGIN